jgi:hypothetical protein
MTLELLNIEYPILNIEYWLLDIRSCLPPVGRSYVVPLQRRTVVAFLVIERDADSHVAPNVPIDSHENVVRREARKRVCRIA